MKYIIPGGVVVLLIFVYFWYQKQNSAVVLYDGKNVQVNGKPQIWLVTKGVKSLYPDASSFAYYNGANPSLIYITQAEADSIPTGAVIPVYVPK